MVALNTAYAPSETRTQPKNRVGKFFGGVAVRAGENRPATRNRIGEKRPTLTIIASGRPVWPSRDPIGELGFNLHNRDEKDLFDIRSSLARLEALIQQKTATIFRISESQPLSSSKGVMVELATLIQSKYRLERFEKYLRHNAIFPSHSNADKSLYAFLSKQPVGNIDYLGLTGYADWCMDIGSDGRYGNCETNRDTDWNLCKTFNKKNCKRCCNVAAIACMAGCYASTKGWGHFWCLGGCLTAQTECNLSCDDC